MENKTLFILILFLMNCLPYEVTCQKVVTQVHQLLGESKIEIYDNNKYNFFLSSKEKIDHKFKSPELISKSFFLSKDLISFKSHFKDTTSLSIPKIEVFEKKQIKKSQKIEFLHKLSFTINSNKFAIIKFKYSVEEEDKSYNAILLQEIDKEWYVIQKNKSFSGLKAFVAYIKSEWIMPLLKLEKSENDLLLNQTIEASKFNNCFDIGLFNDLIYKWRINKENKKINYFYDVISKNK